MATEMEIEAEAETAVAVTMGMTETVENGDNGDGSGRNHTDWEIEWVKGMDGEETMFSTVELEQK
jgi:hypothetical protein